MIIPNTWLLNLQMPKVREKLFSHVEIQEIVDYRKPVFRAATVDTQILIFRKATPLDSHQIKITVISKDDSSTTYFIAQKRWQMNGGKPVNLLYPVKQTKI